MNALDMIKGWTNVQIGGGVAVHLALPLGGGKYAGEITDTVCGIDLRRAQYGGTRRARQWTATDAPVTCKRCLGRAARIIDIHGAAVGDALGLALIIDANGKRRAVPVERAATPAPAAPADAAPAPEPEPEPAPATAPAPKRAGRAAVARVDGGYAAMRDGVPVLLATVHHGIWYVGAPGGDVLAMNERDARRALAKA